MEIQTVAQKYELQDCLEILKDSLFMQKDNFEQTLKNKIPLPYSDLIKKQMEENKIKPNETERIKALLTKIENNLKLLTEINLTLSFKPDTKLTDDIYLWVKKNIGENIILNLNIDPEIIAGAIISYRGLYTDNSAKKKLERVSIKQIVDKYYE